MRYAFFLDIDGTLIDYTYVPEANKASIAAARSVGHLVFLNTGRGYRFIPDRVWDNFTFDGVVCGSGTYAAIGDTVLQNEMLTAKEAAEIAAYLIGEEQPFILEGYRQVLAWGTECRHDYWLPLIFPEELLCQYAHAGVQKINLPGQAKESVLHRLSERFTVLQHPGYAEISLPHCDKGRALRRVMEALPADYISVAIGDSANDLEMLETAEISVAMGNSPDTVKSLCTHETASVREDGVAIAMDAILAGRHLQGKLLQKN